MVKREGIERYLKWKEYVRVCLYIRIKDYGGSLNGKLPLKAEIDELTSPGQKVHMDCSIYFANKRHGDPDNIFKGICDSIFANDKHVVGCFDYEYDKDRPRVEVTIRREGE